MSDLIIRPAGRHDLDVLVNFSHAMALETEGRDLDRDRLRLGTLAVFESSARGAYTVAELPDDRGVIGQLLLTYEWSDWRNAMFWWIQSVYVHPASRRQGVYRQMHEWVLQQARARGDVCGLRLYVANHNQGAQDAYGRMGLSPSTYCLLETDFVLTRENSDILRRRSAKLQCKER